MQSEIFSPVTVEFPASRWQNGLADSPWWSCHDSVGIIMYWYTCQSKLISGPCRSLIVFNGAALQNLITL